MAKRRTPSQTAIDDLREAIQSRRGMRPARIVGFEKRSASRSQRLMTTLSGFDDKDVARQLELPVARYQRLRGSVVSGKAASPELNDMLQQALDKMNAEPALREAKFARISPTPEGKRTGTTQLWEVSSPWIHKHAPWGRDIKPYGFASRQSAVNWLGNVGGASQYFFLVRKTLKGGRTRFHIYDIRTRNEYQNRGSLRKAPSAVRKLEATHDRPRKSRR